MKGLKFGDRQNVIDASKVEYTDDIDSNSVDEHEDGINDNSEDAAEAEINGDQRMDMCMKLMTISTHRLQKMKRTLKNLRLNQSCKKTHLRKMKVYDWAKHFPETVHTQYREGAEGTWSRPYYIRDTSGSMIKRLSTGIFYQDSHFREDIEERKLKSGNFSEFIECWDDKDQYQLYHEALDWLGLR